MLNAPRIPVGGRALSEAQAERIKARLHAAGFSPAWADLDPTGGYCCLVPYSRLAEAKKALRSFWQVEHFTTRETYGARCGSPESAAKVLDRLCSERGEGMRELYHVAGPLQVTGGPK